MSETDFKSRLDCFRQALESSLENTEETYRKMKEEYRNATSNQVKKISENVASIESLHETLLQYQNDASSAVKRSCVLAADLDEVKRQSELLEHEQSLLKTKLHSIQEELKQETDERDKLQRRVETKQKSLTQNTACHDISLYREYLGVEFRTLKNKRLQLLFHDAIEGFPEEIPYVIIQLCDRVYSVLETEPELRDVKKLEDRLNETNNLAGFIQHLRTLMIEEFCERATK